MSAIFISYRREDSAGHTGRLYDHLCAEVGKERVFMDIDALEPGTDFVEAIDKEIGGCTILIVVIGDQWLSVTDARGRRLDNPNDFIRVEIGSALRRGLRVIPVLVKGASMPQAEELPEDIASFARRHALELSDSRWEYDVSRLVKSLATWLDKEEVVAAKVDIPEEPNQEQRQQKKTAEKISTPASVQTVSEPMPIGARHLGRLLIPILSIGILAMLLIVYWQYQISLSTEEHIEPTGSQQVKSPSVPDTALATDAPEDVAPISKLEPQSFSTDQDEGFPESSRVLREPQGKKETGESPTPTDRDALEVPGANVITGGSDHSDDLTADPKNINDESPDAEAIRIRQLLAAAAADLDAYRLTSPPKRNALQRYQAVLEIDPSHPDALRGIVDIAKKYQILARSALGKGQLQKAETYLQQARRLSEDLPGLDELRSEIAGIKQRQEAKDQRITEEAQREREEALEAQKQYEACLGDCEHQFESCKAEQRSIPVGSCEEKGQKECEDTYESCIGDPQRLFILGRTATESECAGEWQQCRDQLISRCGQQQKTSFQACDNQFSSCRATCR